MKTQLLVISALALSSFVGLSFAETNVTTPLAKTASQPATAAAPISVGQKPAEEAANAPAELNNATKDTDKIKTTTAPDATAKESAQQVPKESKRDSVDNSANKALHQTRQKTAKH